MSRVTALFSSVPFWLAAVGCGSGSQKTPEASALDPCANLQSASCETVQAMKLPASLPPARGNKYGDSDAAAYLGLSLFFSIKLGDGVACATCHAPEAAFTEHTPVSTGKEAGTRNAPTVFNAARLKVIFWDGRADSVWSQPLFAVENPLEMGSSRLELVQFIAGDPSLKSAYEPVFGPMPDTSAWPTTGKPGDPAFDALPAETQTEVNLIAANVGKSLEAYMRKNTTSDSALDAFLAGDDSQFIDAAKLGLRAFMDGGCTSCHGGPMLTDEGFHAVGFPSLPGASADPGRPAGIPILENNIFNLAGPFADPDTGAEPPVVSDDSTFGAFRTPSLRNVKDGALRARRRAHDAERRNGRTRSKGERDGPR